MADVTLNIEFGGLCMFVRNDQDYLHSLYVLMPTQTMNLVGHCSMLIVPTSANKADLFGLGGWSIDLAHLTQYLKKPNPADDVEISDLSWALDVTGLTNGKVNRKWLTEFPDDPLAARVRLPLINYTIAGILPKAMIAADGDVQHPLTPYGRVRASMVLKDYHDDILQLGPATLRLDGRTSLQAYVLNVRRCDIGRREPRNHNAGDEIKHPKGYYALLDGKSRDPRLTVVEKVNGHDSICPPEVCPTGRHEIDFTPPLAPASTSGGRVKPEWVDTHDCAIGTASLA